MNPLLPGDKPDQDRKTDIQPLAVSIAHARRERRTFARRPPLVLASDIRAADAHGRAAGEAAVTVACNARDGADALVLLDALGIGPGTAYRWDLARVAAVAIRKGQRHVFSANDVRTAVPARAGRLVAPAIAALTTGGLAEPTGRTVPSTAPGANGRRVRCYRLTRAGELLADDIAPAPGQEHQWPLYRII